MSATPTSDEQLEALLVAAASGGDEQAVDRFCAALLDAEVGWLLGRNDAGDLAPVTVPHAAGHLVPFFTSRPKLDEAAQRLERPELETKVLPCRSLWQMAVPNRVGTVLNPFSEHSKNFTVAEMSDLLAGIRPGTRTREVPTNTIVAVGTPASVPDSLIPALTDHLSRLGRGVQKATLAWVRYPDGLQGFLLVIVSDLPRAQVVDGIEEVAGHTGGDTLDVIVTPAAEQDDLVAAVDPFFPPPT